MELNEDVTHIAFADEQKPITLGDIKEQAIKYKVDMNTVAFIIWLKVDAPSITRLKQLIEFFNK